MFQQKVFKISSRVHTVLYVQYVKHFILYFLGAVNENTTVFTYADGKSHSDYHNESYVPRFLDEVEQSKIDEALKVCNVTENNECVFDYVFTGKAEIAMQTSSKTEETAQSKIEISRLYISFSLMYSITIKL